MRAADHFAASILAAMLAAAFPGTARAEKAVCEAKPIAAARKAAQARRDAGDPSGAFEILKPFADLGCLGAAEAPAGPERRMLSDYAWLLNDAYVDGADERFGRGRPESEACIDLLQPLADEDLAPPAWMSPALRQATIANIKSCAKGCGPSSTCAPFRSNVWAAHMSLAATFRARPCAGGAGQALDGGRCIELRGKAGIGFAWKDHIETDLPTEADERAYCPALYLHAPGRKEAVRLELPKTSEVRGGTFCCNPFRLKVKPGSDEFMIASEETAVECNGGTARSLIEEIYRLAPAAGAPTLVRDNSMGLH